jgi:hypothetical protein
MFRDASCPCRVTDIGHRRSPFGERRGLSPTPSSRVQKLPQRGDPCVRDLRVAASADDANELDPALFVLTQAVPRFQRGQGLSEQILAHCPKIPRKMLRVRAVRRGSVFPEASRISTSQPRSFAVTGSPKMSMVACAAVCPTACARVSRNNSAGSHFSAFARAGRGRGGSCSCRTSNGSACSH